MSQHAIYETVPFCVSVPYGTDNNLVQALIALYEQPNSHGCIREWDLSEAEKPVRFGSDMYCRELCRESSFVRFIVCEGDDLVYFAADGAEALERLRADWGIEEPVQASVELWTVS